MKTLIAKNLGNSAQCNHTNMNGFMSGVISRFEPGVHWVDEDYQLITETTEIISDQQFTITPGRRRTGLNLSGNHNLSTYHLIANYKKVFKTGFSLSDSRTTLRPCDVSNFKIATIIYDSFENSVMPDLKHVMDKNIVVNITPENARCVEADGLAIYAPPGNGKTFAADSSYIRFVDTDYIYDPDTDVINYMAKLNNIVFTNDYSLVMSNVPTVAFIPNGDIAIDRISNKTSASVDIVASWIADLNKFIRNIERNRKRIEERSECVIFVRVSSGNFYVKDIMKLLCRH